MLKKDGMDYMKRLLSLLIVVFLLVSIPVLAETVSGQKSFDPDLELVAYKYRSTFSLSIKMKDIRYDENGAEIDLQVSNSGQNVISVNSGHLVINGWYMSTADFPHYEAQPGETTTLTISADYSRVPGPSFMNLAEVETLDIYSSAYARGYGSGYFPVSGSVINPEYGDKHVPEQDIGGTKIFKDKRISVTDLGRDEQGRAIIYIRNHRTIEGDGKYMETANGYVMHLSDGYSRDSENSRHYYTPPKSGIILYGRSVTDFCSQNGMPLPKSTRISLLMDYTNPIEYDCEVPGGMDNGSIMLYPEMQTVFEDSVLRLSYIGAGDLNRSSHALLFELENLTDKHYIGIQADQKPVELDGTKYETFCYNNLVPPKSKTILGLTFRNTDNQVIDEANHLEMPFWRIVYNTMGWTKKVEGKASVDLK